MAGSLAEMVPEMVPGMVPGMVLVGLAFGLSQVALSVLLLVQVPRWRLTERLFLLLLLAISAYLLTPLFTTTLLAQTLASLATAVPGLFWLLSTSIFSDNFRLRAWQPALVAATVLLPLLGLTLQAVGMLRWVLVSLPQLLEFVLLGLTLWVVARHWRVDLVESRRRLRWLFVALNGVYLFALILVRELLFADDPALSQWQYVPVGAVLLLMNVLLLQYKPGALFAGAAIAETVFTDTGGAGQLAPSAADAAVQAKPEAADPALVSRLQALMQDSAAYRQMGLTIGQLAEQLEVPQYRLRHAINSAMGHRNFNDFLNSYRIAEAAQRLQSARDAGLPILTIAMDAGFRSLSSFNKAFRQTQGLTPTEFRKAAGARRD